MYWIRGRAKRVADAAETIPPVTAKGRLTTTELTALAIILLLVVGCIIAFFTIDVCEEQLSTTNAAVKVCRHLRGTDPPIIALAVVFVAMLGVFYPEISALGVTLKREVREAKETAAAAQAEVVTIRDAIQETSSDLADLGAQVIKPPPATIEPELSYEDPPQLRELEERYNTLRLTMPSGNRRTAAMASVVNRMADVLKDVQDFDVAGHLRDSDRGRRLAAYVYLYSRPEPGSALDLVESILEREDKPFGQYWALLALEKQCEIGSVAITPELRLKLEELQSHLPPHTDRAVLLKRVLERCRP